jgi:hypothetical protein
MVAPNTALNLVKFMPGPARGLFASEPIRTTCADHLSVQYYWSYPIWNVLISQAWFCAACGR